MKICHLADSHLDAGRTHSKRSDSGLTQRQEDIVNCFVEAVDKIIAIHPDLCIHAGDLFDCVRPGNRIMAIAAEQLHRLAARESIPTVIIVGNHDAPKQPRQGAALSVFKEIDNLYVAAEGKLENFVIGSCSIAALPHCLTTDILKQELSQTAPDPSAQFNILVLHGVAAGMPEFSMADLGEQEIPLEAMDRFDYTALGHFHNHCAVGARAFYAGSTERLSQSERTSAKGFLEVDLDPFNVVFHEVAARTTVDAPVIDAAGMRGDQLAEALKTTMQSIDSSDKIVRIKVQGASVETMKTIPSDIMSRLHRESYDLRIKIEREAPEETLSFRQAGISRLDQGFMQFLDSQQLDGFDKERLRQEALKYLSEE